MMTSSNETDGVSSGPSLGFWTAWVFGSIFAFIVIGYIAMSLLGWGMFLLAGFMLGGL